MVYQDGLTMASGISVFPPLRHMQASLDPELLGLATSGAPHNTSSNTAQACVPRKTLEERKCKPDFSTAVKPRLGLLDV